MSETLESLEEERTRLYGEMAQLGDLSPRHDFGELSQVRKAQLCVSKLTTAGTGRSISGIVRLRARASLRISAWVRSWRRRAGRPAIIDGSWN